MTSTPDSSLRRKEILTGALVLGLSFGSFLLGEAGLRAMQFARFGFQESAERSSAFHIDEVSGLRLPRPDRMLGRSRINNLGFRGPDVPSRKPDGVIRLLFMGASTTFDGFVSEEKNWPHLTVTLLAQALPECRFDFINAGQLGFSLHENSILYETRLRDLEPDVAVLQPADLSNNLDWLAEQQNVDMTHYRPTYLTRLSVLWAKLEKNFRVVELQRSAFSRVGKLRLDFEALSQRFAGRLSKLASQVVSDGVTLAVLKTGSQLQVDQSREQQLQAGNTALFYLPHVALPDLIATRLRFNEVVEERAAVDDFDVIDSALSVPPDSAHYKDTTHFTERGSNAMAHATAQALLSSPSVRARLEERGCRTP